jgi:hypothetical protein
MKMTICPRGLEKFEIDVDWEPATPTSCIEDSLTITYRGVDIAGFIADDKYNELVQEVNQMLFDKRERAKPINFYEED